MHKLLLESEVTTTIEGTVKGDDGTGIEFAVVKLFDSTNKMKSRVETDVKGYYKMADVKVELGDYTVKFMVSGQEYIENVKITNGGIIKLNKTITTKSQDLKDVTVNEIIQYIPILNVTVLDSDNNPIDGAKIKIYHNNTLIKYNTFIINDTLESDLIDSENKKTTGGKLKNIWIDPNKYPIFKTPKFKYCPKKEKIKIVAKSKENEFSSKVDICLSNAYYKEKDGTVKLFLRSDNVQNFTVKEPVVVKPVVVKPVVVKPVVVKKASKVNYIKIGFRELIQKSMEEGNPAFILFSKQGERLSDDLINRFNTNQETIDKLNTNYIPVNYLNDETDESGYISASEYLDIDKIPSIVIIKGTKPPQPIDGSYQVIKKITDLGSYFNDFPNYLTMVNDLLK
jgi:hypothetical protein